MTLLKRNQSKVCDITIGETRIQYMAFVDFDTQVSEAIESATDDDLVPLYGTLWSSAKTLLETLAEYKLLGKRVIELGCGLGIPSIFCSLKGAKSVLATDYHPETKLFVEKNAEMNGCRNIDFQLLDWRQETTSTHNIDYIIGSDLLYEPDVIPSLCKTINSLMTAETQVIISDPGRVYSGQFETEIKGVGLQITKLVQKDGTIYSISKR